MTKKDNQPVANGGLKKGKIKRKEMFNQLQTVQQEKIIMNQPNDEMNMNMKIQEQQEELKVETTSINKQKSLDEVCDLVNQLMAKNKINTKNAFDVPIIDLYELINFNQNKQVDAENSWKTLSSTLQNDYKIYAYRVDAIHSITYSILNIINRRTVDTEENLKPQIEKNKQQLQTNAQFDQLKQGFLSLQESQKTHLELQTNKLNISMIQCSMTSDPALQRTKRLFDQPGLKGMLTNSININTNLELSLFAKFQRQTYSMKLTEVSEVDLKSVQHPLKVFQSIQKIKSQINTITGAGDTKIVTNKELQQIWNNVKKGNLGDWADPNQKVWLDVQDPQYRQLDMMIDQNSQYQALQSNLPNKRFIGDYLKMKNIGKKIMTDEQMMIDSQKWMNQIDRKFLGIKSSGTFMRPQVSNTLKPVQRSFDDIDFSSTDILQRDLTLRKESLPKQFSQKIEDKFLTTIRPCNEFQMQQFILKKREKILTLRQEPQVQLLVIEQEMIPQDNEHFLEKQVDVKRQMSSIKEIKDTLFQEIKNRPKTTFNQIYSIYNKKEQDISPALCFLTMLHLANQKNLQFESIQGETDFLIKLPVH